jgi:signal peptidase II
VTRRAVYGSIALIVLALDQVSKQWAVAALRDQPDRVLIDGLLRLVYAENPGIAFSFFNSGGEATRWVLVAISSAATVVVLLYLVRTSERATRLQITLALLLGGITGNLIDRIVLGRVIDFIDVYWGTYHWPTFNIADSAISVGACLLAIELIAGDQEPAETRRAENAGNQL